MSSNSINGFWSNYIAKTDESKLKTLPFFHNTEMSSFEKVESNQWVLNSNIDDRFHQGKKIFFFYGNPVYFKEGWDRPIVMGVSFKNLKQKESLCPTDTGLVMNLVENKKLNFSKKGRDYFYDNLVESVKQEELIPTINKYLENWFGTVDNYCSGFLMKDPAYEPKDCHYEHLDFVTHSPDKLFKKEFLKKNNLDFDKRRRSVELAIGGNVNLLVCQISFIGIPNNIRDKTMKERISFELNIEDPERIYEYDLNDEYGCPISLKDIMADCIKSYHKIYDIKSKIPKL